MTRHCMIQIRSTAIAVTITMALLTGMSAMSPGVAQNNTGSDSDGQEQKTFDQDRTLAELMKQIAGRENHPAEQVFKNIQIFKGVPAGRLLRIMEMGYSRSLGANCTHCHIVDQWDKDDKPAKLIAREMAKMVQTINDDLLKKIKYLKSPNPVVNCTTCHRGQTKPALNLPDQKKQ